jgi:hypothetical protein
LLSLGSAGLLTAKTTFFFLGSPPYVPELQTKSTSLTSLKRNKKEMYIIILYIDSMMTKKGIAEWF